MSSHKMIFYKYQDIGHNRKEKIMEINKLDLEKYKLEDFDTTEPYKDLELIEDTFLRQSEEQRLEEYAKKLGYKHFKRMLSAYRKQLKGCSIVTLNNGGVTDFDGQEAELRLASWNADETGIWRKGRDGQREYACSHPICPRRLLTNIDTGEMKVELWFKRGREGRPVTQVVDYDTIANAKNIVSLAKIGIDVDSNTAKSLVAYLSEVTNMNYDRLPKVKTVSHLGWNREGFAPHTGTVEFDGNPNFEKVFQSVTCKGNMEKWYNEIVKCRAYSKTVHILTAASLASCLIEPLGVLPFFVHLWGMDSGTGKTVAQMCAASIWGNPTVGEPFFPTFKGTQVGFELLAGFLRSIPMFIDELQLAKDKNGKVAFNVYELAAGTGKLRGTKSLGLATVPKWNICFITSGETPLVNEHDGAGALNRVIEVECTANNKCVEDGHLTANTLKANYGFGGKVFVLKLREEGNEERAKQLYEQFFMKCIEDKATEKQAMAASVILTADTLASEWMFGDASLTVEDMQDFIKTAEAVSLSERGYRYICDWVMVNYNSFMNETNQGIVSGQCYGKLEEDGSGRTVAYFYPSVFNKACEDSQINPKALLSHLNTKGVILTDKSRRGYTKMKVLLSGTKAVPTVAMIINSEKCEPDEEFPF